MLHAHRAAHEVQERRGLVRAVDDRRARQEDQPGVLGFHEHLVEPLRKAAAADDARHEVVGLVAYDESVVKWLSA